MNRNASRQPVKVHSWTWRVLKSAQEFSRKSHGVFDITMARQLFRPSKISPQVCGPDT
jgi:thiamine biosynthesis lipoprotein ApbE